MTKFQIPEPFKPGFDALAKLSGTDFQTLIKILKEVPIGIGIKGFQDFVNTAQIEGINEISRTIFSLGNLVNSQEVNIKEISSDLALSFAESKGKDFDTKKSEALENKISNILNDCKNLRLTFKALNLLSENDQIFREARIISDIRLIFNDDLSNSNRAGIIIHKLKIEFQKDLEVKDFYLSLDTNDLHKLKKQIDRALDKEEAIKSNYKQVINFIEISD
jgi:hypothetical protein